MTAAMIFPVMLRGGLTQTQGAGVAQVLKVRLIHALIRHMILRGNLASAMQTPRNGQIPALADRPQDMYQALYAKGWDTAADGLPCNQEELIFTLLTFGYVFLRSLRRLGLGLPAADEEAFLHTWNVVGHLLGIERSLMVDTMAEAERLFARIQTQGRDHPYRPDPRPALAQALMKTMEQVIPVRVLQPFPVLMSGYLCGASTMRVRGLNGRAGVLTRVLFVLAMGLTRLIDTVVRWVLPEFSISRFVTRVLGYPVHGQGFDGPDPPLEAAATPAQPDRTDPAHLERRPEGPALAQCPGRPMDRPGQLAQASAPVRVAPASALSQR